MHKPKAAELPLASLKNKEAGHVNVHPFWVCPRNLLWHNIFIASQSRLVTTDTLWANILGNMATLALSLHFDKLSLYFGLQLSAWAAWVLLPASRTYLTAPELLDVVDAPPPGAFFF
jgi:hypothetical protein